MVSYYDRFRQSALRLRRRFGAQDVTIERASVGLLEAVSGDPATLVCGGALEDATSLPMTSSTTLSGRLSPGVEIAISGHSATYTVQSTAEPVAAAITVAIDPGLESDVSGEAVTLSPRSLAFEGGPVSLDREKIPAGWTLGAGSEVWALVPPTTAEGREPRDGDRMTVPFDARIGDVGGRERIEYLAIVTPMASAEAV